MKLKPPHAAAAETRGMSILVALIIVSILLVLASAGLKISSDESEIASYDLYGMQAFYCAESGIMHASAALAGDFAFSGKLEGTIEISLDESGRTDDERSIARYEAVISPISSNSGGAIVSTGFYMGVKRVLRAEIESRSPLKISKYKEQYD